MFIAISVMEQMGYKIKTVALPSLGTGNQMLDFTETTNSLLTRLDKHIQNNLGVERIIFVEYTKEKSRKLSDALDKTLNRVSFGSMSFVVGSQFFTVSYSVHKLSSTFKLKPYCY